MKTASAKSKIPNKSRALCVQKMAPKIGDSCFAKVRGYAEWPGICLQVEDGHVWVKFFNAKSTEKL